MSDLNPITAIKGMNDILPNESALWLQLEQVLYHWLNLYQYKNIRTPILEATSLFRRSIGDNTDIVEKEMYSFIDQLNNDSLTLRPEGTASVIRAVMQHNLMYHATCKLWYMGPMFRHERPQLGRYRQFHHLGVEAFGFDGADIDSEIILMQYDLWQRLGITQDLTLEINSLGNKNERMIYREILIKYFEQHLATLDNDANNRLYSNPLRILDSKNPNLQDIIANAPKLINYLSDQSLSHHDNWKNSLKQLNIPFRENYDLVRGLDYYNLSVFEWTTIKLGSQATVAAGGHYDPLVLEFMYQNSKNNNIDKYSYPSGIGFAIGLERLLLLLQNDHKLTVDDAPDVYIITDNNKYNILALSLAHQLRANNYKVIQTFANTSVKSQLKKAITLFAKIVIIYDDELMSNNQVTLKIISNNTQHIVHDANVVNLLKKLSDDNS